MTALSPSLRAKRGNPCVRANHDFNGQWHRQVTVDRHGLRPRDDESVMEL